MPVTFNDSLLNDLDAVFFNENEFAELVTIERIANSTPTTGVAAIRDDKPYPVVDSFGANVVVQSNDFLFVKTAYVVSSLQVDPRPGDRITDASGNKFEVMPITGMACFEASDRDGIVIRVHTKRVKAA